MKEAKMNLDLLVIVGPTATGKTKLGISLAKKFNGEIVNADSMQVYKYFNIGVDKPSAKDLMDVKYHLIDIIDPRQDFSLFEYVKLAKKTILDIKSRNKLPILVGGTGLYINCLINNTQLDKVPADPQIRHILNLKLLNLGAQTLWDELAQLDPQAAQKINVNDHKRLIRALEIIHVNKKSLIQTHIDSQTKDLSKKILIIGLNYKDRELLYQKINDRVDRMISLGLASEAKEVLNLKLSLSASQAIGYKEFLTYFRQTDSIYSVTNKIKLHTRRYAKRQITWFNKNKDIHWIYIDQLTDEEINNIASNLVNQYYLKGH